MRRLFHALALFLFLPLTALAQDLPNPLTDTVSDFDGILSMDQRQRLTDTLAKARAETGVHVVLVVMQRRENHGGQGRSIEDYTKALFNRWGVGDSGRNDGVMILLSTTDHEMRVQLGSGYGSEWDGVAQGVIDTAFLPKLRAGDTAGAIEDGTEAVIARIARPFASGAAPVMPPAAVRDTGGGIGAVLLFPVIFIAAIALSLRRFIGDFLTRLRTCPQCGQKGGLRRERLVTSPATTTSDGWGRQITSCLNCSYRHEESYTISHRRDRDRRGGGGGGGFGGGRSSGGGATGRW